MSEARLPIRLAAERRVQAPREEIFEFLSDLDRHWLLGGRYVRVVKLAGPAGAHAGGVVRLQGPLGLSRTVRTRVQETRRPSLMTGQAEIGESTEATVIWTLTPVDVEQTHVELRAEVLRAGRADRVVLAFGGRRWLQRMFDSTLAALAEQFTGSDRERGSGGRPRNERAA
jgi:hypothetical protein